MGKLPYDELHYLYSSFKITGDVQQSRMKWARHGARMGDMRNIYTFFVLSSREETICEAYIRCKINLKWILEKNVVRVKTGLTRLMSGSNGGIL
jgi:hypothetical protein